MGGKLLFGGERKSEPTARDLVVDERVLCKHGSRVADWTPGTECSSCIREMLLKQTVCFAVGHQHGGDVGELVSHDGGEPATAAEVYRCARCGALFL